MKYLYLILATDLFFAIAIWLLVRDHKKKMAEIYKKWDDKHERTESDRLKLDKWSLAWYTTNITTKQGDNMAKQLQPTIIPPIGSVWVSTMNPDAIKIVTGYIEKHLHLCVEYIRLDTNTKEFEPRNQFQHHNKRL